MARFVVRYREFPPAKHVELKVDIEVDCNCPKSIKQQIAAAIFEKVGYVDILSVKASI